MAQLIFSNPPGAPTPSSPYSQACLVEGAGRRLVISGQVGVTPDGTVLGDAGDQAAQALANIGAILAAHGMGPANIVKMTVFLTDPHVIPAWRRHRAEFLGGHAPTSTLLIVAGLANPDLKIEVEAEAVA
jgi:enamine deaminase RidA (YjgF/YER057c/UK114 family)